eukprot:5451468-Pleurochrysis_carterae.AAC.1
MQLWELDAHCSEIGRSGCAHGSQVPRYDWAVVKNEQNWRLQKPPQTKLLAVEATPSCRPTEVAAN